MFALWHKRPLLVPPPVICRHLQHRVYYIQEQNLTWYKEFFMKDFYYSNMMILEIKAFTLESSRETVSCPATLFLLVSLLGIGDVNRLAGRDVCQNKGDNVSNIVCASKEITQTNKT